jgi:hypothetical protein
MGHSHRSATDPSKQIIGEGIVRRCLLRVLDAHLAPTDPISNVTGFERLLLRFLELLVRLDRGQPEAEGVGEVVAGALGAVALDERRRAEVFEAGAGADEGLAAAFGPVGGVLDEGVSRVLRNGRGDLP